MEIKASHSSDVARLTILLLCIMPHSFSKRSKNQFNTIVTMRPLFHYVVPQFHYLVPQSHYAATDNADYGKCTRQALNLCDTDDGGF